MKQLLRAVVILVTIFYPFMVYWGLQHFTAASLLPLLLLLLILRWLIGGKPGERGMIVAVFAAVLIIGFIWGQTLGLKFYPVLVNLGLLVLFGGSLFTPTSFVERLARLRDPELPAEAIGYTRRVTWLWTIFFVVNGSIAMITAVWASNEIWVLYNGLIAYLAIGLLAGGEWLVRRRVMQGHHHG